MTLSSEVSIFSISTSSSSSFPSLSSSSFSSSSPSFSFTSDSSFSCSFFPNFLRLCFSRKNLRLLGRFFLDCLLVYFSLLQCDLLMDQVSSQSRKIHFHHSTTSIIRR